MRTRNAVAVVNDCSDLDDGVCLLYTATKPRSRV